MQGGLWVKSRGRGIDPPPSGTGTDVSNNSVLPLLVGHGPHFGNPDSVHAAVGPALSWALYFVMSALRTLLVEEIDANGGVLKEIFTSRVEDLCNQHV